MCQPCVLAKWARTCPISIPIAFGMEAPPFAQGWVSGAVSFQHSPHYFKQNGFPLWGGIDSSYPPVSLQNFWTLRVFFG